MSDIAQETPAAPGTGETTPASAADPTSPAGALNTVEEGGTPETIPYSRFKEVNDAYRPFKELSDAGYDADSLRRLADWEATFAAAPAEQWLQLANQIEGLPESVKEAIRQAQSTATPEVTPGSEGKPDEASDKPPAWAEPLIEDYSERRAQRVQADRQQVLDNILAEWDKADEADVSAGVLKVPIPATQRLSFIAGAAPNGNTPEEILQIARKEALDLYNLGRESVVVSGTGPVKPVPSGAGAPSAPAVAPKTLAEATAMAKADMAEGRLKI